VPKSTSEMLEALERLIDEYSTFQRSRPDLPQASLAVLSEDELEQLVAEHTAKLGEQLTPKLH
jgi:hypothetical protein